LLLGADLTTLSEASLATVTNPEVLTVDQDSLGLQGVKVASYGDGLEVWSKALSTSGERAVLLLNRTGDAASISAHWTDLGLEDASPATVRDLWIRKDLGSFDSNYTAAVQPNDAVMVIVRGRESKVAPYSPDGDDAGKGPEVSFSRVASRVPTARIRIVYTNSGTTYRYAELRVNGRIATRIAFPPTGGGSVLGAVWIEALLDRTGSANELNFSPVSDTGLGIVSIGIQ
jgi:hypothetical protein